MRARLRFAHVERVFAAACARVLRRAGADRVDVLALAIVTDDSRIGV